MNNLQFFEQTVVANVVWRNAVAQINDHDGVLT